MLVIDNDFVDRLQAAHNHILDLCKGFVDFFLTVFTGHKELQRMQLPFPSKFVVIVVRRLLDRDIGQVHKSVLDFFNLVRVPHMCKPGEPLSVQEHSEWLITSHEYINTHVEFLPTDQQWVHDVLLNHVWFSLRRIWLPPEVIFPLLHLLELVQKEDTFALRLANRLHYPDATLLFEFFHEERVVTGQIVSGWEEIVGGCLLHVAVLLKLLLFALKVLYHQIFPSQLKVVPVVINSLVVLKVGMIQNIVDNFAVDPKDVPVLATFWVTA